MMQNNLMGEMMGEAKMATILFNFLWVRKQ